MRTPHIDKRQSLMNFFTCKKKLRVSLVKHYSCKELTAFTVATAAIAAAQIAAATAPHSSSLLSLFRKVFTSIQPSSPSSFNHISSIFLCIHTNNNQKSKQCVYFVAIIPKRITFVSIFNEIYECGLINSYAFYCASLVYTCVQCAAF